VGGGRGQFDRITITRQSGEEGGGRRDVLFSAEGPTQQQLETASTGTGKVS
jgi:hypothetical protein